MLFNFKNLWFLFSFMLALWSCKTKQVSPLNYDKNIIEIGNGGGFTGASTSYFILESGEVFRGGNTDTSFVFVGKIEHRIVNQQFNAYEKLGFKKLKLNDPGNRYFFLNMKNKMSENKIQWGRSELENPTLAIYHRNMMKLIRELIDKQEVKK